MIHDAHPETFFNVCFKKTGQSAKLRFLSIICIHHVQVIMYNDGK